MYVLYLFTFLDNGIVLQVKSDCSQLSISNYSTTHDYSVTPDWMIMVLANDLGIKKSFKFCQNGNCCSTGVLSFTESHELVPTYVQFSDREQEKLRCKQNNYTEAYELGECGKFNFDLDSVESIVMTHITLHAVAHSGSLFHGEQFNVSFVDSMIEIALDVWTPEWVKLVLGNRVVVKCSFKGGMDCKPEGKILFCSRYFDMYHISSYGVSLDFFPCSKRSHLEQSH